MSEMETAALCRYRLSKAESFLHDAEETLKLGMYENAANRSYYAIFHSIRAVLALDETDFSKHSGVISYFQLNYIKTGLLPVELSSILKSAFSLRTESDCMSNNVWLNRLNKRHREMPFLFYRRFAVRTGNAK